MQFRTQIPIPKSSPIDYYSKMVSLGSCFAEMLGLLQVSVQPFGIIFNPIHRQIS
jgi:hypothetical protein